MVYVQNQPVSSCCGRDKKECGCGKQVHNEDFLPLPKYDWKEDYIENESRMAEVHLEEDVLPLPGSHYPLMERR